MFDEDVMFYGLKGFFCKCKSIKEKYKEMNYEEKRIYKMYVYSTCFEDEQSKDLMWEYLNDVENSYLELCKEMRKRRRKRLKYENKNRL
jgi:hypothetical protein